jgi:hypothetical protein
MLLERSVDRLNGAVHDCLEECYRSGDRIAALSRFVAGLRASGWPQEDIDRIQVVVRHILAAVVQGDEKDQRGMIAALPHCLPGGLQGNWFSTNSPQ